MLLLKDLEQLDESYSTLLGEDNFFFQKYVNFLTSLNLRNTFYKKDKYFGLRELNGVEKRKVFNNIDFSTHIYGNPPTYGVHLKNEQWKTLNSIVNECNSNTLSQDHLQKRTEAWFSNFQKTSHYGDITPYIHIFTSHLHQQVEYLNTLELSISSFSMQGIEYMNNFDTKYFHRSTNKKGDVLESILKKRTRIELLQHHNQMNELIKSKKKILPSSISTKRTFDDIESSDKEYT